jgi:ribonuclease BN (tRNA processing enzyme)
MRSQLVVLGSCGAWPEPGKACAGFLIEHDGVRIVVDLGYGTAARLLAVLGSPVADGLDAVIVSHSHPDHMVDLHALLRARWFGRRGAPAIPLFAPDGVLTRLVELEDGNRSAVSRVFDWHPIPAPPQSAGPFRLDSMLLPHYVPNAGVRLSAPGLVIAYTGDTGPAAALADLGRDCDLYIVDATGTDRQPERAVAAEAAVASEASEAGLAGEAGVAGVAGVAAVPAAAAVPASAAAVPAAAGSPTASGTTASGTTASSTTASSTTGAPADPATPASAAAPTTAASSATAGSAADPASPRSSAAQTVAGVAALHAGLNMTAAEAGSAAAAAGARRLLLTHFWPGTDRQASKAEAARAFGGEILLAEEGAVIPLP